MPDQTVSSQVELDEIDRQLIAALIRDGRATYAKLAPEVGLSQAAVRTRVQRLLDESVITITGRVDPTTFGLGVFAFAFLEVSSEIEKVTRLVSEIDEAVFVVVGAGRFDVLVELRCATNDALLGALDRIRVLEGVRRVQSMTVLHYEKQDWTGIGNHESSPSARREVALAHEFDDIDRALLRGLMADGRATYSALAPLVGLSQAAVRDRVIDLLGSGIITIQAHPVPEAMGIAGFAGIAVKAAGPVGPLANALSAMPETTLVVRTLGRFDLMAEVWFDDHDHLAKLLDELRDMPGMGSIDTLPYLWIAFEEFDSGPSR
ncbi:MAG: AsnC family transcriptional regulator [Acidimicrobiia bacterium]|nr:AsnC family transcriptional regulator [Acidimicrobiia bacterium]